MDGISLLGKRRVDEENGKTAKKNKCMRRRFFSAVPKQTLRHVQHFALPSQFYVWGCCKT
jgi:hypothetical protein